MNLGVTRRDKLIEFVQTRDKNKEELLKMFNCLTELTFFKKFFLAESMKYSDQANILNICAKITHESFRKGDIIIKQGDLSNDKLYVVIWGKVAVVLNFGGGGTESVGGGGGKGGRGKQMHRKGLLSHLINLDEVIAQNGKKVNSFSVGEGFGEKALMAKKPEDARRAATIIAESDRVDVLVLMRLDFQSVLNQIKREAVQKNALILRCVPKFERILSNYMMDQLAFLFKPEVVAKGQIVIQQGQTADWLILFDEGQYEVSAIINYRDPILRETKEQRVVLFQGDEQSNLLLGDEAIAQKSSQSSYLYTVTVTSTKARVFTISRKHFLQNFPREIIRAITANFEERHRQRTEQLDFVQGLKESVDDLTGNGALLETQSQVQDIGASTMLALMRRTALLHYRKQSALVALSSNTEERSQRAYEDLVNDRVHASIYQQRLKGRVLEKILPQSQLDNMHLLREEPQYNVDALLHAKASQSNLLRGAQTRSAEYQGAKKLLQDIFESDEGVPQSEKSQIIDFLVDCEIIDSKKVTLRSQRATVSMNSKRSSNPHLLQNMRENIIRNTDTDLGLIKSDSKQSFFHRIACGAVRLPRPLAVRQDPDRRQLTSRIISKVEAKEVKASIKERSYSLWDQKTRAIVIGAKRSIQETEKKPSSSLEKLTPKPPTATITARRSFDKLYTQNEKIKTGDSRQHYIAVIQRALEVNETLLRQQNEQFLIKSTEGFSAHQTNQSEQSLKNQRNQEEYQYQYQQQEMVEEERLKRLTSTNRLALKRTKFAPAHNEDSYQYEKHLGWKVQQRNRLLQRSLSTATHSLQQSALPSLNNSISSLNLLPLSSGNPNARSSRDYAISSRDQARSSRDYASLVSSSHNASAIFVQ